ncbi:MAG: hypothetical protein PWQ67_2473 [Clostridia bacterium]|jgi:hypothetical protein|nr:hypothetical protein [Clostridia bacterium]MDN5324019.1 hypothetical protein [Clostridia bacterium]
MALVWVLIPLDQANRMLLLGFIAIYLSVHNFIGYVLANKGTLSLKKYEQMKKKMGLKWGPPAYLILFVFLPLALGLYVAITSMLLRIT